MAGKKLDIHFNNEILLSDEEKGRGKGESQDANTAI